MEISDQSMVTGGILEDMLPLLSQSTNPELKHTYLKFRNTDLHFWELVLLTEMLDCLIFFCFMGIPEI